MGLNPHVIMLAGPNGAGKSTTAPALLAGLLRIGEFVNADVIARGLSAFDTESVAMEAGRLMLQRLKELAAQRVDFAFETTLASRSFAPWIAGLVKDGYELDLIFLWLPSVEHAVLRVQERVRVGGHNVPAETVQRRYERGLRNFFKLYMPLAATWRLYDNSQPANPRLVADGMHNTVKTVADPIVWDTIRRTFQC